MQTEADTGIGPVSCKNCSVFKKGEGGPEAPGALRLRRKKKATASVASSYSQNTPVVLFGGLCTGVASGHTATLVAAAGPRSFDGCVVSYRTTGNAAFLQKTEQFSHETGPIPISAFACAPRIIPEQQ